MEQGVRIFMGEEMLTRVSKMMVLMILWVDKMEELMIYSTIQAIKDLIMEWV
jgi:hypothetical protein